MNEAITFWLGCNVVRHGDIIHTCVEILRALAIDARIVGGPDYCCGTSKDTNISAAAGMARRTARHLQATERPTVVAWCPSCHVHMTDVISRAHDTGFALAHFVGLLHRHRERLAPLLVHRIDERVLLHRHADFDAKVPVYGMAEELLRLIPGVSIAPGAYIAPAYQCAALAPHPHVMQDLCAKTLEEARAGDAALLVTLFHQCYRELLGLDTDGHLRVCNYIHLLARSMGIESNDDYKTWKQACAGAKASIGEARMAAIGEALVDRAILPELARRPYRPE